MSRIIFIIIINLLLVSCNNGIEYKTKVDDKNHLIDLGEFSIIVPLTFKYKKKDGIDSFVGEISNGKTTFRFDYGRYSPQPPLTKNQYLEKNEKHLDLESKQIFFSLIDLEPYLNDEDMFNPSEITKKIENLKLNEFNDNITLSKPTDKTCEYYYSFVFENKEYKIPFFDFQEDSDYFKYFRIEIDTIENYQRTLSIWTKNGLENYSSVNLIPLENRNNKNELWLGISSREGIDNEKIFRDFK